MTITNLYAMTDNAIAETVGQRIENMRLAANKSQQQISDEVGITRSTYRKLILGQAKLQTIIAVLRALNELPLVDDFIPDRPFSPMALLELEGKQRQRASKQKPHQQDAAGESEW